ncbi:hypothetical protein GCM10010987_52900 [Bradyrhizobium guangdongense]|uniref:SGNH/GDSL hydrolase family protein n=1 Tax=Bradyrhizobium guangdongense TaxID=1325090 RepID=A0A410V4K6_9BRAD|nr:hypothetical protein X265_13620 [Bradyrhizobium guangdongense]QOZ59652.1 hypothetical protein XH86_13625 [Bradyrhizobium guangdongense]GGI29138.1 hypothetical protein GCM10010987_52900 [Bradyrhizobium guangdongense]
MHLTSTEASKGGEIKNPGAVKRALSSGVRLLGAWLVVFAFLGLSVEGVARLLFPYVPPSVWDYRSSRPPAYKNSPFFSQDFIQESRAHQNWINPKGTRIIYPGDYSGRWFNVSEGIRRTVGSPSTAERRILLIGSSTIYNAEVPDDFTIASRLQAILKSHGIAKIQVLNFGASGVNVAQQLERLKTLTIAPQDIVLFYDGTGDAMQGVFYANFDGWIVGENRKHLDNFIARNRPAIERLARYSRFFNWLYAKSTNYLPEHLKHPDQIKSLAVESEEKLLHGILETNAYVRSKGAAFVHVLQPDLFTRPLRDFELPLVQNHFLTMEGTEPALRAAHDEFKSLTGSLTSAGVVAFDATNLLNDVTEPVYLDFAHTNELANQRIAEFLFEALSRSGTLAKN